MNDDEKAEKAEEKLAERARVKHAALGAGVAAGLSFLLVCMLLCSHDTGRASLLQPLLALSLSVLLTLGARSIDGPIRLAERPRQTSSTSAAGAVLLLWLGCFLAIQAAFLVVDLVSGYHSDQTSCPIGAKSRGKGTLTIEDGAANRTLAVVFCEAGGRGHNG